MSDYSSASEVEKQRLQIQRMIDDVNVSMPASVVSFNPTGTPKVVVQPLTQLKVTLEEGVQYLSLPVVEDVPVVLPYAQSAGLVVTLPIQPGDTGLLIIPDRGISNFLKGGGKETPPPFVGDAMTATPRAHSLTDAIFIPGLSANSAVLESYDNVHIELRDKARKNYISLGDDGIVFTDGQCTMRIADGALTVTAPNQIRMETPGEMHLRGSNVGLRDGDNYIKDTLRSRNGTFIDRDNVVLNTHAHTGVQSGSDDTGQPVK